MTKLPITITLSRRMKFDVVSTLTEADIKIMVNTIPYEIIELLAHYCAERIQ